MAAKNIVLHRGDVVRVRFDPTEGHEQAGVRPAVVLSPELINENLGIVMVAAITSKRLDIVLPIEVLLEAGDGGLKVDSKVMLMQTRSIDKRRVFSVYGTLSAETMKRIDMALSISTGLTRI